MPRHAKTHKRKHHSKTSRRSHRRMTHRRKTRRGGVNAQQVIKDNFESFKTLEKCISKENYEYLYSLLQDLHSQAKGDLQAEIKEYLNGTFSAKVNELHK